MGALTAADGLPLHFTYTYDKAGNTTQLVQAGATKSLTTDYVYDSLGRLTGSSRTDGAKATYSYDANGNQTAGTDTDRLTGQLVKFSATYTAANQETDRTTTPDAGLSLDGPAKTVVTNTFDHAGNLTGQSTASTRQVNGNSGHTETTTVTAKNTFDYSGRLLTQARDDGQNTAYAYDGLGRTVSQTLPTGLADDKKNKKNGTGAGPHLTGCGVGGTTPGCPGSGDLTMFGGQTARVFNDGLTPIAWATSTLSTDLVYGPQGADHQLTTTAAGKASSWLYLNRQRTVRATAGPDGVTTSASSYSDFGVLEPAAGTLYAGAGTEAAPGQEDKLATVHLPVATTRIPVGYTGEQTNPVAGLQHYYARDYQPGLATWIQADPWIGIKSQPGTLAKYVYALSNPATIVDYMGNRPWDPSYNAVPDGHGSWNMYPKSGVTTSGGNTPPAFNWANPDGETPPPYVSNEPTGETTQSGPAGHSQRYSGLPACSYMNIECTHAITCAPTDDSSYCQTERFWQDQLWQVIAKLTMEFGGKRLGPAESKAGGSLSSIEQKTFQDALRPDKLDHIFAPKHNFDSLTYAFGGREALLEQMVRSLGKDLPAEGSFEVVRSIGGHAVTIRGAVVDGVPRIGTAFIP